MTVENVEIGVTTTVSVLVPESGGTCSVDVEVPEEALSVDETTVNELVS